MKEASRMENRSICIWCGRATTKNEPPEHIVPEAIGCPEGFVLKNGEVCASCNHGLAHLDQALIHDLELCAFMAGVRRKRNKPPKISSHGNLQAEITAGHASYFVNMDPLPVKTHTGRSLPGFRGRKRDVKATLDVHDGTGTISWNFEFGRSPKVARALVKLGAEYLCWVVGAACARSVIAGPVAEFVTRGKGHRPVIIGAFEKEYRHDFGRIAKIRDKSLYCVFRLAHFEVVTDLGPELAAFREIATTLYATLGRKGWTTLPPEAISDLDGALVFANMGAD